MSKLKLNDLHDGWEVFVDGGFGCVAAGLVAVHFNNDGEPYFLCEQGRHYLGEWQCDDDGYLIGITSPEDDDEPRGTTPGCPGFRGNC